MKSSTNIEVVIARESGDASFPSPGFAGRGYRAKRGE